MIGKKLRELIKLRNVKQIQLAKYVGISPSRLSNYLSDKREPDIEMLAKMARYLSVDLNYFTDIKFPSKKDANYNLPKIEDSVAAESKAEYCTESSEVTNIPYLSINSKKRAAKNKYTPIYKFFLKDIKDPGDNSIFFEVTTGIGGNKFSQGDYLLAAKFNSVEAESGVTVFETGRNGKCYKYINDKGARMLLSEDSSEVIFLKEDTNLESYYVVLWVFKKTY